MDNNFFIEAVGYVGSILLVLSGIPQLIKTYRTKDVEGVSLVMCWLWGFGCIFMCGYVLTTSWQLPLLLNYILNGVIAFTIAGMWFKYKKR